MVLNGCQPKIEAGIGGGKDLGERPRCGIYRRMKRIDTCIESRLAALLAVGLFAWLSPGSGRVEAAKPNVLILYADDLGFGDLGCYNPDSKIPTPNLNQLAAQGMTFHGRAQQLRHLHAVAIRFADGPASLAEVPRHCGRAGRFGVLTGASDNAEDVADERL